MAKKGERGHAMARGRKPQRSESGHEVAEYLIIVALVAIAAIGIVSIFGDQIQELFSGKSSVEATRPVKGRAKPPSDKTDGK